MKIDGLFITLPLLEKIQENLQLRLWLCHFWASLNCITCWQNRYFVKLENWFFTWENFLNVLVRENFFRKTRENSTKFQPRRRFFGLTFIFCRCLSLSDKNSVVIPINYGKTRLINWEKILGETGRNFTVRGTGQLVGNIYIRIFLDFESNNSFVYLLFLEQIDYIHACSANVKWR